MALASVGDQEVKRILKGVIMLESADGLSADTSAAHHPHAILTDVAATLALVISGRHIRALSNIEARAWTLFGYLCDRLVRDTRNSCPGLCEPK